MKRTRTSRAKPACGGSSPRRGISKPALARRRHRHSPLQRNYLSLFEHMRQGAFWQFADGTLIDPNPAALELLGLTRDAFLRRTSESSEWQVIREDGAPLRTEEHPSMLALRTGHPVRHVVVGVFNPRRSQYVWLEISATPEFRPRSSKPYRVLVTLHDLTEHKREQRVQAARFRLLEYSQGHSLKELLVATLDEAEALTGSQVGFYHFLGVDQTTLSLQAWSTRTSRDMCRAQGQGPHYPVAAAGVWVDCIHQRRPVIHNDYASLPHRKGLPEGHVPVTRELVVPVLRGDRITAILGVGNKPTPYDEQDVQTVARLADLAWDIAERRRAEEQYRRIVEAAREGVWAMDREHRTTFVNPQMAAMLGCEAAEMLGLTVEEFMFPEDLSAHQQRMMRRHAGQGATYEHRFRRRDGSELWTIVSATALTDTQGRFDGSFAMFTDITERKRAQETLRESEERFHAIADYTVDVEAWFDPAGKLRWINTSVERVMGYLPAECLAMPGFPLPLIHPDDRTRVQEELVAARQGGRGDNVEFRFVSKAGAVRWGAASWQPIYDAQGEPLGHRTSVRDITRRKQAEEARRESDANLRALLAASTQSVLLLDVHGAVLEINEIGAQRLGRRREDVLGTNIYHHLPAEMVASRRARLDQVVSSGQPLRFVDTRSDRALDQHLVPIFNDAGQVVRVAIFAEDVTRRRRMEEELRRSERLFRLDFEEARVGRCLVGLDGRFLKTNHALCTLLGRSERELSGLNFLEITHPEDRQASAEGVRQLLEGTLDRLDLEKRYLTSEQRTVWASVRVGLLRDGAGSPLHFSVYVQDITERKQAEQALQMSEEKYRLLVENAQEAVYVVQGGRLQFVNRVCSAWLGFSTEELLTRSVFDLAPEAEHERLRIHHVAVLEATSGLPAEEFAVLTLSGETRWLLVNAVRIEWEGQPATLNFASDITERKHTDDQFRILHELALALAGTADLSEGLRLCLEAALSTAGLDAGGFYLRDDRSGALEMVMPHGLTPEFVQTVSRHEADSDRTRLVARGQPAYAPFEEMGLALSAAEAREGLRFLAVIPLRHEGTVIGCLNVASHALDDLAPVDRRALETIAATATQAIARLNGAERLRASETLLNQTQRLSKVGGWEWDVGRQRMIWTEETYRIHDLSVQDFAPGSDEHVRRSVACYAPDQQTAILTAFRRCAERGEAYDLEVPFTSVKGRAMWVRTTAQAVWEGDRVVRVVGNLMDITERKQAEAALQEGEERLRLALRATNDVIWDWDVVRDLQRWNQAGTTVFGWSDIVAQPQTAAWWTDRVHPEDHQRVAEGFHMAVGNPACQHWRDEYRFQRADGTYAFVLDRGYILRSQDGHARRMIGAMLDITERKQAEAALRKLSQAVEQSPASVMITDLEGNIEYVNRRLCELTGYDPEEIQGRNPRMLQSGQTPRETYRQLWAAITRGDEWAGEILNRKKDGDLFWERAVICPIKDVQGRTTHYLGIKEDVTQRKQSADALRASEASLRDAVEQVRQQRDNLRRLQSRLAEIQEKERRALARELHDQVGQTLTGLGFNLNSLMASLPKRSAPALRQTIEDSLRLLQETSQRVRDVMAELRPSVLDDYGLVPALKWYAGLFQKRTGIPTDVQAPDELPRLAVESESQIFRIVQEALTNVAKHSRATRVVLAIERVGGTFRLELADNGCGIPAGLGGPSAHHTAYGLMTMRERAEALGGSFEFDSAPDGGARVMVEVPLC